MFNISITRGSFHIQPNQPARFIDKRWSAHMHIQLITPAEVMGDLEICPNFSTKEGPLPTAELLLTHACSESKQQYSPSAWHLEKVVITSKRVCLLLKLPNTSNKAGQPFEVRFTIKRPFLCMKVITQNSNKLVETFHCNVNMQPGSRHPVGIEISVPNKNDSTTAIVSAYNF